MNRCDCCKGSGRLFFITQDIPLLDMPPGCAVILSNAEVVGLEEYLDPERPMQVDGLEAHVIAFELPCYDCSGEGYVQ